MYDLIMCMVDAIGQHVHRVPINILVDMSILFSGCRPSIILHVERYMCMICRCIEDCAGQEKEKPGYHEVHIWKHK